jgi:arabinose-5-phosphate isomerase
METSQLHRHHGSTTENHSPAGPSPLGLAREVLLIESRELESLANRLDQRFVDAVRLILQCRGRVVVSGMGKSGHIGRKIASTFASTGSPAFFVHPGEASHGDLGMITGDDLVIALSNSGESEELLAILPVIKRLGAPSSVSPAIRARRWRANLTSIWTRMSARRPARSGWRLPQARQRCWRWAMRWR